MLFKLSDIRVTSFTYKMAAKTSRHRYGTKLSHHVTLCIGLHVIMSYVAPLLDRMACFLSYFASSCSGRKLLCVSGMDFTDWISL